MRSTSALPATRITGWGSALPARIVANAELAERLGVDESWIEQRTGIRERHVGSTTRTLAADAGMAAIFRAGLTPEDIDLLILATTTPDFTAPATSSVVHQILGLNCGTMDVNAACAGFVHSLVAAHGFVAAGCDRILVIGADTLSRITDQDDRDTAVLLADGAAAVVLERSTGTPALLAWNLGTDSSAFSHLYCQVGDTVRMNGREVFRRAVRAVADSAQLALNDAGIDASDVRLLVPHQANRRIIEAVCAQLCIAITDTSIVIDRTGNTSAASIPLALADAADTGSLESGDVLLLAGFGAGMAWGSAVLRWGGEAG